MNSIPMPIIEEFCIEDKTPTEPKMPISKDDYKTAISALTDVATLAGQCFCEAVPDVEDHDKQLAKLCQEANIACDKIIAYLVHRSI